MNTNLDHLPASKQEHLTYIVDVIRDELAQITGFTNGKKKHSRLMKVILFGSHATGKWVNDPAHGYVSDYDILIIVSDETIAREYKIWHRAEDRIALRVRQPLNLLVHTWDEVNTAIREGQYFFNDIRREGILLYQGDTRELDKIGNLTSEEAKAIAEMHYKQWYKGATSFLIAYKAVLDAGDTKNAAFQLHQATERYFACILLVFTNYKPNTHNLKQLKSLAILQDERIADIFPQDTKIHRRRFELLKNAYIDARYSEHYQISQEELEWLAKRVKALQALTETLCKEKIDFFGV